MKIKQTLMLALLIVMLMPVQTSGHAYRGRDDEGSSLYIISGNIAGYGASAIFISQLANNSAARDWEVALVIQVNSEEVGYWVQIHDSHMARDNAEPSSNVLEEGGKVAGSAVFGPYIVLPADPAWGDLIWEIIVLSLDGRDTYFKFIMVWEYGDNEAPSIDVPGEEEGTPGLADGQYSFWHIIELAVVMGIGIYTAHRKSKDNLIAEKKYEVSA